MLRRSKIYLFRSSYHLVRLRALEKYGLTVHLKTPPNLTSSPKTIVDSSLIIWTSIAFVMAWHMFISFLSEPDYTCYFPFIDYWVGVALILKTVLCTNVPYSDGASSDSYLKWTDVRTEFREIDWFFCTSNLAALLIIFLFWTAFYLYRSLKGGSIRIWNNCDYTRKSQKRQFRCRINRILDN